MLAARLNPLDRPSTHFARCQRDGHEIGVKVLLNPKTPANILCANAQTLRWNTQCGRNELHRDARLDQVAQEIDTAVPRPRANSRIGFKRRTRKAMEVQPVDADDRSRLAKRRIDLAPLVARG